MPLFGYMIKILEFHVEWGWGGLSGYPGVEEGVRTFWRRGCMGVGILVCGILVCGILVCGILVCGGVT